MSKSIDPIYGWWSDNQAKIGGYSEYTTPDGSVIKCSMVSPSPKHQTFWDDIKCIGVVVDHLRTFNERGQMTSESYLGRKQSGKIKQDNVIPLSNDHLVDFIQYKGLTTFTIGRA
jgi:hypothetical protein